MNDKQTLDSLKKGQVAYEQVVNKEIHYVYLHKKTNLYHELIFTPKKENFLHLCGIDYYNSKTGQKYSAKQFYDLLKKDRIDIKGINKKNTANQKLQVIQELKDLTTCHNLRIVDEKTVYLNLVFDKAIRSRKNIFGLALERAHSGSFVPKSLLNLKSNPKGPTFKPGHPVHCIYIVDKISKDMQVLCRTVEFIEYEKKKTYPYKTVPQRT